MAAATVCWESRLVCHQAGPLSPLQTPAYFRADESTQTQGCRGWSRVQGSRGWLPLLAAWLSGWLQRSQVGIPPHALRQLGR